MSTFTGYGRTNEIDFGDYVHYPHGMSREPHIYKVVGAFESNTYRDVPDWFHSEETNHGEVVKVLNIIHCGIDETKVIRVKESDCVKLTLPKAIGTTTAILRAESPEAVSGQGQGR